MQRALQYVNKMRRVLARRGKRREDIEDLMQDAFVRILEYTRAGHEVREPEALLVRTAQRLALNHTGDQHLDLYVQQPVENLTIFDPGPAPQEVHIAFWARMLCASLPTYAADRRSPTLDSL